jgi:preprotein translocase subunit SecG
METVIIIVHLIIVLALIGVVLLQRSEGGLGLGGGGGVSGFMTGRGQANALTRATAVLAGLFFLTSLVLTVLASYGRAPRSIFEGATPPGQTAPAGQPAPTGQGPGVLEQLQRMQGEQPAAPSGGAATPATPQVPQSQE